MSKQPHGLRSPADTALGAYVSGRAASAGDAGWPKACFVVGGAAAAAADAALFSAAFCLFLVSAARRDVADELAGGALLLSPSLLRLPPKGCALSRRAPRAEGGARRSARARDILRVVFECVCVFGVRVLLEILFQSIPYTLRPFIHRVVGEQDFHNTTHKNALLQTTSINLPLILCASPPPRATLSWTSRY